MTNHPNRSTAARKIAQAAGYYVREGSFVGGSDDCSGRWYIGKEGEDFRPFGRGYDRAAKAWVAAAELAEEKP